jgi:uncharacterized membrane protein
MKKLNRFSSDKVAYYGACLAVIFVFFLIDTLISLFPIFAVSIAVTALPVALAIILLAQNFTEALIAGFLMGFASFMRAIILPVHVASPYFINPLVSVFPRILVGIGTYSAFRLMVYIAFILQGKKTRRDKPATRTSKMEDTSIMIGIAAVIGATINTFTVLPMLSLFRVDRTLTMLLQATIAVNYVPEVIVAAIIVPLIVISVARARNVKIAGVISAGKR